MSTASTCDVCGTPVVFQVHNQRDDPHLEANQREGVGVCPSCGAGFHLLISRTREPSRLKPKPKRDSQPRQPNSYEES